MPRPKSRPDTELLGLALALMQEKGPEALTFASLAERSGLSAATLVQRFGSKPAMMKAALAHAWDGLAEATERAIECSEKTPQGAIDMLVSLSVGYGGIETYADGLLILREDLRDPDLRGRGKAWEKRLCEGIDACFEGYGHAGAGFGHLMASHWQGTLLWWSFDPATDVASYVSDSLAGFLDAIHPQWRAASSSESPERVGF